MPIIIQVILLVVTTLYQAINRYLKDRRSPIIENQQGKTADYEDVQNRIKELGG